MTLGPSTQTHGLRGGGPGPVVFVGAHVSALFVEVDRVPLEGETVLGSKVSEPIDGGKSTCQAIAAARMGAPAALVSVVGTDDRGGWWSEYLEREGVDTRWLLHLEGATDIGLVLLPPSRVPAIVSVTGLSRQLDPERVLAAAPVIRSASRVVCALECPVPSVETAFRIAREAGVPTLLNPSPAVEGSAGLLDLADLIVANEIEATQLAGHPGEPGALAEELASRLAPASVVVTAGPDGAWTADPLALPAVHASAPTVDAVDTTGAGDAFLGALVARLHAGDSLADAVALGVRAATLSVLQQGSIASYPRATDLARVAAGETG